MNHESNGLRNANRASAWLAGGFRMAHQLTGTATIYPDWPELSVAIGKIGLQDERFIILPTGNESIVEF